MADIELVIKIPKQVYNYIRKYEHIANSDALDIKDAIINGTPLPKGHGRLIDADELEELFGKKCVGDCGACMTKRKTDGRGRWYDTCSLIETAPTIIKADKSTESEASE